MILGLFFWISDLFGCTYTGRDLGLVFPSSTVLTKLRLAYTGRDRCRFAFGKSYGVVGQGPSGEAKNADTRMGICIFWYTGRDSNPQPSEPESDALSIEPPVRLLYS